MGKVISILNHKGGVGKTATAVNLGAALKLLCGYRVLFVDMDGQANLTDSLGLSQSQEVGYKRTINDAINDAIKGKYELPIYENKQGLEVAPSCLDLSAVEMTLIGEPGRETFLKKLLEPVRDTYDFILVDCPPSLSLLTLNAMTASDSLIIPVQSEYLAIRGMTKLTSVIKSVKERLNGDLEIEGVLITQYDSRKNLNKSIAELVNEMFAGKVFKTYIRENVTIAEATSSGCDVISHSPTSAGAKDYTALCEEFLSNNAVKP
ncbi:Sporulation initiation inhibitor protein Soj [termite gut metagenome]|uniref:Sporulation initiation inhibitor protein Soj n=1 Tax=termite gut metagenome TaxID=433724 RepID=A0A5J4QBX9_9ZZZZ